MATPNPNLREVEYEAIRTLMRRFARTRLYLGPMMMAGIILTLAYDPTPWRRWAMAVVITVALARIGWEYRLFKHGVPLDERRLPYLLILPSSVLGLMLAASGGIDSPALIIFPIVTVFISIFIDGAWTYGLLGAVIVWVLAAIAWWGWVPTMVPLAFGGGATLVHDGTYLLTRATVYSFAIIWGWVIGTMMRLAYRDSIRRALAARDEALQTHQDSARALTTMAAEIAHEVKNPLASVKGLAALLARDVTGKSAERLEVLRREVDRMQEVLDSFLTFSRPLVPLSTSPVALEKLVRDVAALHEGLARQRQVRLDVNAPPLEVRADARKLTQVLVNLVQNAIDASPTGAEVDVVVSSLADGAQVEVRDRGPGFSDAQRAMAFEPGYSTKSNGHGLGLTVARLLARQHGGDVQLLTREGGGTVAQVTLKHAPPG